MSSSRVTKWSQILDVGGGGGRNYVIYNMKILIASKANVNE